ncbi:MAG: hypothetical protein ACTSXL_01835 [Alphaproteobacteria bacterium]
MNNLILFKEKKIRRTWHNEEWWFCVADVVEVLTDSVNPSDYLKKLRSRDEEISKGWGQIATPLAIDTTGGKQKTTPPQNSKNYFDPPTRGG